MADSKRMWTLKTLGLVVFAAFATALVMALLQQVIWGKTLVGVTTGAAISVAVTIGMVRRRQFNAQPSSAPPAT